MEEQNMNNNIAPTPPSRSNEQEYGEKSPAFSWSVFSPRKGAGASPSRKADGSGKRPNMSEIVYGVPKSRVFGKFHALPYLPLPPMVADKKVPWFWFPYKLRLLSPLFLRGLLWVLVYMFVLLFSTILYPLNRWIPVVVILVITAVYLPVAYLMHIMELNYKVREGISFSAGKSVQARAHYRSGILVAPHATYFQFDLFPGGKITVLNDGTQEFWNANPTLEFNESFNRALGFSGFVSVARSSSPRTPTRATRNTDSNSNSNSTVIPMTDMAEKSKRRIGESVDIAMDDNV